MNKLKDKFKSGFKKAKRILKWPAIGILSLHLLTQANYTLNDFYNSLFPSEEKKGFFQEFGFPINGSIDDMDNIEKSLLYDAIYKEKMQKPFNLSSLIIRSDNYFKKPIFNQLEFLFTVDNSGYYNQLTNNIVIGSINSNVIQHEVKHRKTDEILELHPELLERWEELAKDEKGNSFYKSGLEQVCLRFRLLNNLVEKDDDIFKNRKNGFVSDYAITNVYEDIAELCEATESMSLSGGRIEFFNYFETPKRIKEKVRLAQEYGLIPKEFEKLIEITQVYRGGFEEFGHINQRKLTEFFENIAEFEKNYSNSIYLCDLREARARFIEKTISYKPQKNKEDLEKIAGAYKHALNSQYKDIVPYQTALMGLRDFYKSFGELKKSEIYSEAYELHLKRFHDGFMHLAKEGVNDFLREKGELK